jgi:type I restriction enzyme, S subunit
VLELADTAESVDAGRQYGITGVYSFGKGLIRRPAIQGNETAYSVLHRINAGQVVMSKLNAWEGAISPVGEDFNGTFVSPEYPVYNINSERACPSYIAHLVMWPQLWDLLTPHGSMVRRKRTTPAKFLATEVPLPDIDEQRRVAARLNAATRKLDQVSTLKLDQSRKAMAFRDALLSWPSNRERLGDIVVAESDPVRVESSEIYPTIGIYSYGRGVFRKTPSRGSETSYDTLNRVKPGQFIYSKLFAWEGALAMVPDGLGGCYASNEFPTFALISDRVDSRYFSHVVRWPRLHDGLKDETTGMGSRRQRVNVKRMLGMEIPLPPLSEQRNMAAMLDAVEQIPIPRELAKKDQFKDVRVSLLNAAFAGRL